jgi:Terminase large subunit, T4likevirus-type, N-terminal
MIRLKSPQWTVFQCDQRFRVLVAGRRFGKTFLALVELCRAAWAPGRLAWYVAPTYKQAKRITWKALKKMTQPYWASRPNETDLRIELISGGTICLRGADNYDSLRGDGLDFLVLDEYASMAPQAWTEVLRPALADRKGKALFISTPQGFNHLHELYESAQSQPDWKAFQFTTAQGGNVAPEELQSAAKQLDERTYRQEFEASFETLGVGRAYYAFDRTQNVGDLKMNRQLPLCWSLDFNMNPLCSVLTQIHNDAVHILEEIVLPDSNTLAACEEFLSRTAKWWTGTPLHVSVYGDATAEQRRTSASRTDWQIVKEFFGRYRDQYTMTFRAPSVNPPVKDRVNCVNAKLRNHNGQHLLLLDRSCKHLIRDFEQVRWKTDPHGNPLVELDKSDPMRTHVSDAIGYLIAREFPMRPVSGFQGGSILWLRSGM